MATSRQLFLNDLYSVLHWENIDAESFRVTVSFNPDHNIYKVHFPGNPITPGACLVQIATELLSSHFSKELILSKAKNIKFINLINPIENKEVDFVFRIKHDENGILTTSIGICRGTHFFVKISASFMEYGTEG